MSSKPALNQIASKPLRERVLDVLRDAILTGELKPGQPLIETDLASQLGVSRAPLREALQILSGEGLAETIPYHGTRVRRLTKSDIEELYSLRILLESFAIRQLIERDAATAADELRVIYEDMLTAAQSGDISRVSERDRHFHDTLIALSGHNLLRSVWSNVSLRVRQVMALVNRRNSDITQVARNHLPIVEAIAARDVELAVKLIHEHAASAADLIIDGWQDETKDEQ